MAVPFALIGMGMQLAGTLMANYSQAKSELRNAKFFQEQADFAREAMFRQEDIANSNYAKLTGVQLSAYAKGGVDISGSAASVISSTMARRVEEITAIRRKGEIEYKLAYMRGRDASDKAAQLQDPFYNLLQIGAVGAKSGVFDNMNFGGKTTLLGQSSGPGTYTGSADYTGNYDPSKYAGAV